MKSKADMLLNNKKKEQIVTVKYCSFLSLEVWTLCLLDNGFYSRRGKNTLNNLKDLFFKFQEMTQHTLNC